MPRAYGSLALAASSHPRSDEDRLTEICAVALEAHGGFATRVFDLAGLPGATRYEAYTQEVISDGSGRLDLRVVGFNDDDECVAVLYAEHKEPHGGFQPEQPEKYLPTLEREMRDSGAEGGFMVVVGTGEDGNLELPRRSRPRVRARIASAAEEARRLERRDESLVVAVTWQDIAIQAELAGRECHSGGNAVGWRDAAVDPDAPAAQRILCELLWYFEQEGYAVTNGLTQELAERAGDALEIDDTLANLIDGAAEIVMKIKFGRRTLERPRGGGRVWRGQEFRAPAGSWLETWYGRPWLGYDRGTRSPRTKAADDATFQVGISLPDKQARILGERAAFRRQLRSFRYDLGEESSIWAEEPVTRFVRGTPDETLETQAQEVANWAAPWIERLLGLRPGRRPQ